MPARAVLIAAGVLALLGVIAALLEPDEHVGPQSCARRVASALHLVPAAAGTVDHDGSAWAVMVPTERLVLRVSGRDHRVTGVEAFAGAGADVLERPDRLRALAVTC